MSLRLHPAARADLDDRPAFLKAGLQALGLEDEAMVAAVLDTLTASERPAPWGGYWGEADGRAVGLCAFKAAPDTRGEVEIAYMTFPDCEGRGFAGAMARALVETARAGGAAAVVAHTLPADGPSCSVLRRAGFAHGGSVIDPEDGEVWAWRLQLAKGD
ncbi:MAG: GNAT family N-acetyltransferase [Caulobacteraceae bacterium]|nr:GNAT family N-acetyltransferase [Caulobacteraceae bacterium]